MAQMTDREGAVDRQTVTLDDVQAEADRRGHAVVCTRDNLFVPLAEYIPPPRTAASGDVKFVRWPATRPGGGS